MADVKVTFAFVTPRSINCCAAAQCNDESTVDVSETLSGAPQHDLRAAIIKVLDYDTGHSRVFCMTYPHGTRMRSVCESLADAMAASAGEMVCFTPPPMPADRVLRLCAMRVLEPGDNVPDVLFCQKAAAPRQCAVALSSWMLVNVLLCRNDGVLSVGHLPCVVQVPGASITKDGICSSLCALLRMGLECERYLRSCALFCCTVERKSIVLRDPFHDGGCPSQVAIIYGAVDVGDVVLVSAALPCAAVEARPSVLQAVVVRRFAEDGVTLYDVKEVDTAVVLEGLTCTQLVPL
ncbi:conserved hypothetical protein [Leishmania infantum JPCM5]|uniref:Uncharacterized protein n=2 Tax=Leishmania infantum TaxID=5671 RepID=A4I039_LEIIN|nr:conserved hypothetical protein [Leishmania infantum JPCM5]CAC9488889.1 hypothetical_protein_-_conserved [Leishmania infantum]CAM68106.1 conserved hypothetical protein [Leishmania infantum JPCM5]SUZ41875.1 hypothetical_protein_-_conserved [Leishmania infantum]|eukprot:XP_001465680.1 conserved hypothetical protein [Leishmania infantum JPCM5]